MSVVPGRPPSGRAAADGRRSTHESEDPAVAHYVFDVNETLADLTALKNERKAWLEAQNEEQLGIAA